MKKTIYIGLLITCTVLLFGMWGCEKEFVPPANDDFSDAVAGASGLDRIQRGGSTSFVDLSQGVTNRTWEIPASASILNLEGKEPSELDIVIVQFNEPGVFEVGLKSEFKDGTTTLDTAFEVTVLDFIKAEIQMEQVNAGFFEVTPSQITMYEGGMITYSDSSQGAPNRRMWTFEGGDPRTAGGISVDEDGKVGTIDVQYPEIGVYDVQLITWRQFPEGDPDTLTLKDYVNVVENVDPPELVEITENEEGIIQAAFNLEMKIVGDLTSNFTLMVDDTLAAISKVSVNPQDRRVIDITPEADIEHWSTAILSYDGNGELSRINDIPAAGFAEVGIALNQPPNLLVMAGIDPTFESGDLVGWNPELQPSNGNPATNNSGAGFEHTTDARFGNGALVVHLNENEDLGADQKNNFRLFTLGTTHPLTFEEGKSYRIEFWYKVVGEGAQEFTSRFHGSGWAPAPGGGWSPGGSTDWKFRQITWNAPNPSELNDGRISIQFISKANNTKADVYFDNMTVYAIEE